MSKVLKIRQVFQMLIMSLVIGVVSCSTDEEDEVVIDTAINASTSANQIYEGQSVIFTDETENVLNRNWTFEGGSPELSDEESVTVMFDSEGSYTATLDVEFTNGEENSTTFTIEVLRPVYPVYTENPDVISGLDMEIRTWDGTFPPTITTENVFEGDEAVSFNITESSGYAYGGFATIGDYIDFSEYEYVHFAIRSTSSAPINFRVNATNGNALILMSNDPNDDYGFERDGDWHEITIPVSEILEVNPELDLTNVSHPFALRSDDSGPFVDSYENYEFVVDDIYWVK